MQVKWHNAKETTPIKQNIWAHQNNIAHGSRSHIDLQSNPRMKATGIQAGLQDKSNQNLIQDTYNFTEPLSAGKLQQKNRGSVSFEGLSLRNTFNALFKPKHFEISGLSKNASFDILDKVYTELGSEFRKNISDFVSEVKSNAEFRKRLNITDDIAKNLSEENLISLPYKNISHKLIETVLSPVTVPIKGLYKMAFAKSEHVRKIKHFDELENKYSSVLDYFKGIEYWENKYRSFINLDKRKPSEEFIIPDVLLEDKTYRKIFKSFDPKKGQYSTNWLGPGNRIVSGLIGASYLSNDAFNTTMHLTGDKDLSKKERRSRFFQEGARIGLSAYMMGIALSMFKKHADRSMIAALAITAAVTFSTEVMGRKLLGKAILPSDKQSLDAMDEKRRTAKGVLPSIGRFLTGEKVENVYNNTVRKITLSGDVINQRFDTKKTYLNFTQNAKTVSFTGAGSKAIHTFQKAELGQLIFILDKINPELANFSRRTIERGFEKLGSFNGKDISALSLDDALKSMENIPVSIRKTKTELIKKTVGAPIYWVRSWYKGLKNTSLLIKQKVFKATDEEVLAHYKKQIKPAMQADFESFVEKRKGYSYLSKANLNNTQKEIMLSREFLDSTGEKFDEELVGVKNVLLCMKKKFDHVSNKKVSLDDFVDDIQKGQNKYKKELEDLKQYVKGQTKRAFAQGNTEYDTSSFSIININLSRAITTGFLVTDAYNRTMQYSNNDSKEAKSNAKQRAAQEASRIAVSAYILNFFHTWLSPVINGTLLGAYGTTALTSNLNEISSRAVVGRAITPKSQKELIKIDEELEKSKNPIKKALVYLIGKRSKAHKKTEPTQTNSSLASMSLSPDFQGASADMFVKKYLQQRSFNA